MSMLVKMPNSARPTAGPLSATCESDKPTSTCYVPSMQQALGGHGGGYNHGRTTHYWEDRRLGQRVRENAAAEVNSSG